MSTPADARATKELTGDTTGERPAADDALVEMHRRIAVRLLADGAPVRAFNELVRASRSVKMNGRLAAALTRMALSAQTYGPAALVLNQGLENSEGPERLAVLRQLARLTRRAGNAEESLEAVVLLLAERPGDRRARAVLNALLEGEGRWAELDASLEKEVKEALRQGRYFAASRASLRRARLWDERLSDGARAALRYAQAAQYAERAHRFANAFPLRLLALRALQESQSPQRAIADGVRALLASARLAGQRERALAMLKELGLQPEGFSERSTISHDTGPIELTPPAAAPATVAPPRRVSTQLELMAVADEVARSGRAGPEVAAVLAAAARDGPDQQAARRLEAHYVQHGAWRELTRFYRDAVARAQDKTEKAAWAEKLAELLESEFDDVEGAAAAWAEVVSATGDPRAVSEQVRLLGRARDHSGVRTALDEGVRRARSEAERARALVLRAEEALTRREVALARSDFEAALGLLPDFAEAAAGLAELSVVQGDYGPVRAFEHAISTLPRGATGRGDLYRRLARLAGPPVSDARLGRLAWAEVLVELPGDEEATVEGFAALRAIGDRPGLERALRTFLEGEPRGPRSREAWLELVALCDASGRPADALEALKSAVRAEPGHRAAWLAYAERLERLPGREAEAVWAWEHAATATEDGPQRLALWRRLAWLARQALGDEAKAAAYAQRAERLEASLAEAPPPRTSTLPGGPLVIPRRRGARAAASREADDAAEPTPRAFAGELAAGVETRELPHEALDDAWDADAEATPGVDATLSLERSASEFDAPPPAAARPSPAGPRRTQELPVALGDADAPLAPSFGPSPAVVITAERQALFERVRKAPLEPDGYRLLAEHFDTASDPARSSLMLEIARALEGDPDAAPRTPRLILNATDRAGLLHPALRKEAGELMGLVGVALCRLYPTTGKHAGSGEEFHLDAGKGAKPAADALLAAVRILGLRAPEVEVANDPGPPFSLVYTGAPLLLVGRLAVKKESSDAELRFFAGRALFTQLPELMALRNLRRGQLVDGLKLVAEVARGHVRSAEGRVVRDAVSPRAWERLRELVATVGRSLDYAKLVDGARASVNRAGLVVCGGVAPAVAALRLKRALSVEMTELVRFAASERYLQMRSRALPRR